MSEVKVGREEPLGILAGPDRSSNSREGGDEFDSLMNFMDDCNESHVNDATQKTETESKRAFDFPFDPYPTQKRLMEGIYDCIQARRVGFFESPTGTGKSLSAICSVGRFIKEEEARILGEVQEGDKKTTDTSKDKTTSSGGVGGSGDWLEDILAQNTSAHGLSPSSSSITTTLGGMGNKGTSNSLTAGLTKYNDMKKRVTESVERHRVKVEKYRPSFGGFGRAANNSNSRSDSTSVTHSSGITSTSTSSSSTNTRTIMSSSASNTDPDDSEFILQHYDSDNEKHGGKSRDGGIIDEDSDDDDKEDEDDDAGMRALRIPQLLYCSRTHSQVSQFVNEMKKTAYSDLRCVTLGSRRTLCINDELAHIKSDAILSERCLEMAKHKQKQPQTAHDGASATLAGNGKKHRSRASVVSGPCFAHKAGAESAFGYTAVNSIRDVEELALLGREVGTCPYYGTRRAVQRAHVVCMPYTLLLNAEARRTMGIRLEHGVVVVDEAHNIVDAINTIHSADVSGVHLARVVKAINAYVDRFKGLLGGKNLYYLNLLQRMVEGFQRALSTFVHKENGKTPAGVSESEHGGNGQRPGTRPSKAVVMSTNDFIFGAKLDDVNTFKLGRHIAATNLERKIGGYADTLDRRAALAAATAAANSGTLNGGNSQLDGTEERSFSRQTASLRAVLEFITCLKNSDADGRVVLQLSDNTTTNDVSRSTSADAGLESARLRFRLMHPASHFESIVSEARSVILLGGTLQPFPLMTSSLVPSLDTKRCLTFSCDHVVPRDNVVAAAVSIGPTGRALNFKHATKSDPHMILELYSCISHICLSVPAGKVAFFTSYAYMDLVLQNWSQSGLLTKLRNIQPVLVEPRGTSEVEKVWAQYSQAATKSRGKHFISEGDDTHVRGSGALLLCVMGGKMSEGINFSNDLARGVICIGMPFPDSRDPILAEQLRHADSRQAGSSKAVYEGMCMRVVNQSIGRSIRHMQDHASIILLDQRYADARVKMQLPGWIQESLSVPDTFTGVQQTLKSFFQRRR